MAVPAKSLDVNPMTLNRWATVGCRSPGGVRLRLESVRVGSKIKTSVEAVKRFLEQLSQPPGKSHTVHTNRGAAEAAAKELVDAGA